MRPSGKNFSQYVIFDNPRTVTTGSVAGLSVYNAELVRLAAHSRFTPVTASAADAESKGKVEALAYVKSTTKKSPGAGTYGR